MKVKGLRWMVIGLIMLITIINYLDRGTLNYMWVANIDYHLVSEADASADKGNHAVLAGEQYILTAANGNRDSVSVANVQMKEKNGVTFVTNREGIAIDLGLIDRNDPDASQKAKDILGLITIFFMIAYGISRGPVRRKATPNGSRRRNALSHRVCSGRQHPSVQSLHRLLS